MKSKKEKLDVFHYHEAIDRCDMVSGIIENQFLSHPVIQKHKKLRKLGDKLSDTLAEFYSQIAKSSGDKFK